MTSRLSLQTTNNQHLFLEENHKSCLEEEFLLGLDHQGVFRMAVFPLLYFLLQFKLSSKNDLRCEFCRLE